MPNPTRRQLLAASAGLPLLGAGLPGVCSAVISNRPDAAGLAWAAGRGITTVAIDHRGFASRGEFDAALAAARGLLLAEQGMGGSAVTVSNIVFVGFGVAVVHRAELSGSTPFLPLSLNFRKLLDHSRLFFGLVLGCFLWRDLRSAGCCEAVSRLGPARLLHGEPGRA